MTTNFIKYLESKGLATNTIESVYGDVLPFIDWAEGENIEAENCTYNDILAYIQHLKKRGIKQRTVQVYTGAIKHYYNWLIAIERRETNPVNNVVIKGVKRKILYNILPKAELERLYDNYKIIDEDQLEAESLRNWQRASQLADKRNKVMTGLLVYQGLNSNELSKLEEKDVKLREGKIYVAGSRRSNERELKLEPQQMLEIMEYTLQTRKELLQVTGKQTDKLFISIGQSPSISNTITKLMQKLRKQNPQVENIKQIRTSVITHWLGRYNLREVQYMAGHRYVSSTEAYKVNDLDGLQEEVNKYYPID